MTFVDACTFALIDEDTHLSLRSKLRVIGSVPLRKRAPSKSLNRPSRICIRHQSARTSPSTFLFLPSSQCQRADLCTRRGRRRWKQSFRIFENRSLLRLPGSFSALLESVSSGGDKHPSSPTSAGYKTGKLPCQHPILNFRITSRFQRLAEVFGTVRRRRFSDGGLYGGVVWVSTAQNDKIDIFAGAPIMAAGRGPD